MHTIATYDFYLTRLIRLLSVVCTVCIFLYGIFLLMAVTHAAKRTAAEKQMNKISAHLGDIEATYLREQQALTPDRAAALGFVAPTTISTVYAMGDAQKLTLNTLR